MIEHELIDRKSNLASFEMYGLFGIRDIIIPFNTNVKILIGENGLGKTSVLNALYYTLTGDFWKLNSIVFDKLILRFHSGNSVEIKKEDIIFISENRRNERNTIIRHPYYRASKVSKVIHWERQQKLFDDDVTEIRRGVGGNYKNILNRFEKLKAQIKKEIQEDILYFPTYRRIEEELHNLGSADIEEKILDDDTRLIQFGMGDVQETFDLVLLKIKNSAIQGFSSITGEMLSQYVDGLHEINTNIELEKLNIILERIGENITAEYKKSIVELVDSGKIFLNDDKYKYLLNFLANLIKIYEQQEPVDNLIKKFAIVCNEYLTDKKVIYNESAVTLYIVRTNGNTIIELEHLSSGEKQIISLFAKIYLRESADLIILFDEPELSLSIEWQAKLLPDILKSNKCNLLFSVTHSPFIFDNELDMDAEDINKYVRE